MTRHRKPAWLTLIFVASATSAVGQTTPPPEETDPSSASSPHQRGTTSSSASEAPATSGGSEEPSSASSPHQRQVTKEGETTKSVTPESFASQAAVINKAEIELGQIALKNTKDEDVRMYAQRVVKDHSAANKKLKAIAAQENIRLPQSLDQEHESIKMKLQGMTGEDFDREYMKAMEKGHDKAVALFESASQEPQMPADLKQFAASTLPTLEKHKEMATSLSGEEGGAY